jgi:amidase
MNFSGPDRHIGPQLMAVSGPLARSVGDLRLALTAMAAEDLRDPWWVPVPLELGAVPKRAALTVAPDGLNVASEVQGALRDAAARLSDAGWHVVETPCPTFREPARLQATLWLSEYRRGGKEFVLKENDPDACFVFEQMESLSPPTDFNVLLDALQTRATLTRAWQTFLAEYPLLICPVSAELPFPDLADVRSPDAFRRIMTAQLTQVGLPLMGLPGLTVSTGMVGRTPVGVQLVAGRYREDVLLQAGEIIERGGTPPSPVDPFVRPAS